MFRTFVSFLQNLARHFGLNRPALPSARKLSDAPGNSTEERRGGLFGLSLRRLLPGIWHGRVRFWRFVPHIGNPQGRRFVVCDPCARKLDPFILENWHRIPILTERRTCEHCGRKTLERIAHEKEVGGEENAKRIFRKDRY
jgi:hypothetical protein